MFRRKRPIPFSSALYDQDTFYGAFLRDMHHCRKQLIIESPFITDRRVQLLLPVLQKLRKRGVQIIINTRSPEEHDNTYQTQAARAVLAFQALGIVVLYTVKHHRKLAVIDGEITWEGSLNILSSHDSCEIMRRIAFTEEATMVIRFIGLDKIIKESTDGS
jgi:phosphatidylserine/phosphatidylglycerophosphate/cardiolipin synthase-like enzyme